MEIKKKNGGSIGENENERNKKQTQHIKWFSFFVCCSDSPHWPLYVCCASNNKKKPLTPIHSVKLNWFSDCFFHFFFRHASHRTTISFFSTFNASILTEHEARIKQKKENIIRLSQWSCVVRASELEYTYFWCGILGVVGAGFSEGSIAKHNI